MPKLTLTPEIARRVVESGSDTVYYDLQSVPPAPHIPPVRQSWRCWFVNEGRWPVAAGEMVGVVGLADSDLPSSEAVQQWRRSGLRLRVKRVGWIDETSAAWLALGVAVDEIPVGETGRGAVFSALAALVWRDPSVIGESRRFLPRADWLTVPWTDPSGTLRNIRRLSFVKYPGEFTCIDAARPDEDENVFSLLIPSHPGPTLATVESVDTSSDTAVLTCGVTASAPLHRLTAADVGRRVLLFRDSDTRAWYILPPDPA